MSTSASRPTRVPSNKILVAAFVVSIPLLFAVALLMSHSPEWSLGGALLLLGSCTLVGTLFLRSLVNGFRLREADHLLGYSLQDLDALEGSEFETWVAIQLRAHGYTVKRTPNSRDFGVDLIASRRGLRIGVEVKRHQRPIGNQAVRSIVAGCQFHRCQLAAVITQSRFTPAAERQAEHSDLPVVLIDRDQLLNLRMALKRGAARSRSN